MSLKSFFLLLSVLTNFSLAVYVWIRNPKRTQNRIFSIFILNLVAWSFVNFLISGCQDASRVNILGRWAYTFGSLIPANFLLFCLFFPKRIKKFSRLTIFMAYSAGVFFVYIVQFTKLLQKGVILQNGMFRPALGILHPFWAFYEISGMGGGLYYLFRKWKDAENRYESLQIKTVFIGITLATLFGLLVNVVLPALGISQFVSLGPTMTVVIMGFITYAIVKYRLFDITVALKKTLLYTLLTGLVTSVYMVAILSTERFLRGLTGYQSFIPIFLVSVFLAFAFLPIREKLQNFVDKVFFKRRYDYTKILKETAEEISKELNLRKLLQFIVDNICEAMGIEQASIWLRKERGYQCFINRNLPLKKLIPFSGEKQVIQWLEKKKDVIIREELEKMRPSPIVKAMDKFLGKVDADISVPIFRENQLTGFLFLSNKKSGDIFTQEDINLLLTITSQAGIALENALLYDEAQNARIFQENILSHMVSGVIGIEKDGIIRIFNKRASKFLGKSSSKIIGKSYKNIIKGEVGWVIEQVFLRRKNVLRWEVEVPESEGKFVLGVTGVPLIDKENKFSGVLVVLVDLTEIRRLESELHLAERLAEVGKLSATLAHEIKNPLTPILTFIQLVKEGNHDPEVYTDFADVAYREAQRINNLLQELLDISHPEKLDLEECNINHLIEETSLLLKVEAEKKGISVINNLSEEVPSFPTDENRMKQVIINLGRNAIESMGRKGTLEISTHYELVQEGLGKVILSIKDSGKGIPKEYLSRIFDIFYTTKKNGTGLGLALVKKVVEAHGGDVEVESEVGKGSEFRIVLPVRIKSEMEAMRVM